MSTKAMFIAAWLLVIALQVRYLMLLGVVFILAVFLYNYRPGAVKMGIVVALWYWFTATFSLFAWLRLQIWFAAWAYILIAWFGPIVVASVLPFQAETRNPASRV